MTKDKAETYRFTHKGRGDIDVYSPELGTWLPFRGGVFETEDRNLANALAVLRDPQVTLPKGFVIPSPDSIHPLGWVTPEPGENANPAIDMDDPQRQASRANAPTGSPLDEGPERVRTGGAEHLPSAPEAQAQPMPKDGSEKARREAATPPTDVRDAPDTGKERRERKP